MKVVLRERERTDGNKALYLDISHGEKRVQEFLDLYLVPEIDGEAKKVNENAMRRALAIRSERILHPETISFKKKEKIVCAYPHIKTLDGWLDQYGKLMGESGVSHSILTQVEHTNGIIRQYLRHIKRPKLLLRNLDREFVAGFLAWLRTGYENGRVKKNSCPLSAASLHQYQMRFNCVLNRAVREGLIKKNPFYGLGKKERYQTPAVRREYLTKEELEKFLSVETDGKATQQAFGFASFTGLRLSDIIALTWGNITDIGGNRCVSLRMKKTREAIVIPLGRMALRYLPAMTEDAQLSDPVFHLPTHTAIQTSCKWIAKKAGIDKNVSFNTSRHTYATLTLEACHDIKMVSKLLGHKSVLTTQIYAEVQMASKVDAVNHLNGNFGRRRAKA